MPSAVPRLWCACSSRCSSFSGDGGVVLGAVGLGGEDQRGELGLVFLPVAVDPAVALLDPDQRPRQVVVDEVVALAVHVHPLGGHVAGEQDPHRLVREGEALDDLLLLDVGEPAVHDVDLARPGEPEPLRQHLVQPLESGDALGEDDRADRAAGPDADFPELGDQRGEFGGVHVGDLLGELLERGERLSLGLVCGVLQPVLRRLRQGLVRGEERLEQRVREQAPLACDSWSVVAEPGGGELAEDPLLFRVAGQ